MNEEIKRKINEIKHILNNIEKDIELKEFKFENIPTIQNIREKELQKEILLNWYGQEPAIREMLERMHENKLTIDDIENYIDCIEIITEK